MKHTSEVRLRKTGGVTGEHINLGRTLLGQLRNMMQLGGLEQNVMRKIIDGVHYEIVSAFGQHEIRIIAPEPVVHTSPDIEQLVPVIRSRIGRMAYPKILWTNPRTWTNEGVDRSPFDDCREYLAKKSAPAFTGELSVESLYSVHWPDYIPPELNYDDKNDDSYGAFNIFRDDLIKEEFPAKVIPWRVGMHDWGPVNQIDVLKPGEYYTHVATEGFTKWVDPETGDNYPITTLRYLLADINSGTGLNFTSYFHDQDDVERSAEVAAAFEKNPARSYWFISNAQYNTDFLTGWKQSHTTPYDIESTVNNSKVYHTETTPAAFGVPTVTEEDFINTFKQAVDDMTKDFLAESGILAANQETGIPFYETTDAVIKDNNQIEDI